MPQLISQGSYKGARCHVVEAGSERAVHVAMCGRHLSGSKLQCHDWPAGPDAIWNLIICDKCWVELDPKDWKLLRSAGCMPVHQAQERKLKYKADECAKKAGTEN